MTTAVLLRGEVLEGWAGAVEAERTAAELTLFHLLATEDPVAAGGDAVIVPLLIGLAGCFAARRGARRPRTRRGRSRRGGHEAEGHEADGTPRRRGRPRPDGARQRPAEGRDAREVPLDARVTVPARIALDPRREARVSAVTAGTLERILVSPGDHVKAGEALASVLSPELGATIGAHLSGHAKLETARARRDRVATLHADGFSSKSQLLDAESELTVAAAEAEAAEERLRVLGVRPETVRPGEGEHFSSRFSVRSPIAGEVLGIDATLGRSVSGGEPLFHVGNLDEVWLILDVLRDEPRGGAARGRGRVHGRRLRGRDVHRHRRPDRRLARSRQPDREVRVVVPNAATG